MKIIYTMLILLTASFAHAAQPVEQLLPEMVRNYLARKEVSFGDARVSEEEADWLQDAFVKALQPRLGKHVGYKVGLVTREAQQRFGTDQPVRGQLLERMLLPHNAVVPVDYGVRPVCEADLIVVVKDSGINKAKTGLEALEHLKEAVAFVELADSFLATNAPLDVRKLTAANVGARLGVLGERVRLKSNVETFHSLAAMEVRITDQAGAELGRERGGKILSHPLNAVLWLVEDLARDGKKLKGGDLLSLGSIGVFSAKAGGTVTVEYRGLPGGSMKVSVRFQ